MVSPTRREAQAAQLSQAKADFTAEGSPPPQRPATQLATPPSTEACLPHLSTNQGLLLGDNHNSLKAGVRGPTLLQDFILREKLAHFGHERIPERVVHARGAAAHGHFQVYESQSDITRAGFLSDPALHTPVFVRFSAATGARGSADTVRDVRGFAVKFYTPEGNYDLVGNNLPVYFIQDAMKFPDLIHALKPEPHHDMPQASSAHDTFWDFVSLMPESTHMLMWLMSDRALPRSLRMMEGFGVHTFRLVNIHGEAQFVKFHWKPLLGVWSLLWDEAQELAGRDPDFHRRDLWQAIEQGHFPEWELGVQLVPEADEHRYGFDLLDATKLLPEESVPVRRIGRLVLNRNPENFFAESEQVAFHPGHLVPGIDFSSDPLLQGRLFSYTDTQLSRLGGPNAHELPINRGVCPVNNFQRDGQHRQAVGSGRVTYEPNTLASGDEFRVDGRTFEPVGTMGHTHYPEVLSSTTQRSRSPSFEDHFTQPRLFWISQSRLEQDHIVQAFQFELARLDTPAIRQRVVNNLAHVDTLLAQRVAAAVGTDPPDADAAAAWPGYRDAPVPDALQASPALSTQGQPSAGIASRRVAIVMADGVDAVAVETLRQLLEAAGAHCTLVAPSLAPVLAGGDVLLSPQATLDTAPAVLFDALYLPPLGALAPALVADGRAVRYVAQALRHGKTVGASGSGALLLGAAAPGVGVMSGILIAETPALPDGFVDAFIAALAAHRHWGRTLAGQVAPAG